MESSLYSATVICRMLDAAFGANRRTIKKSLAIAVLTVFSGAAYAGSAREQLNPGAMALKLPEPAAVDVSKSTDDMHSPALSAGNRVVHPVRGPGTVKGVSADGIATVTFDFDPDGNPDHQCRAKDLSVKVKSYKRVHKDSRVVHAVRGVGTVKEVFANGVATIKFDLDSVLEYSAGGTATVRFTTGIVDKPDQQYSIESLGVAWII